MRNPSGSRKKLKAGTASLECTASVPFPALGRRGGDAHGGGHRFPGPRLPSTPSHPRSTMASTRRGLPILALAALAACALPASAREDDGDFALRLADRGYDGLANKVIDRMVAGSPTPEKKGDAEYARCELLARSARNAAGGSMEKNPPSEVRARFAAAVKAFDAFARAYGGHRRKGEAELGRVRLNTDFAYYLQQNIERFPAAEKEAVHKEANAIFDGAIGDLQKAKQREDDELKQAEPAQDPDEAEKQAYARNFAWYNLCVALHDRAMLLPAGDALRTQHLTRAIEETNLFLEETDGYIWGFYASMYLGLCHWHRAESGKAFDKDDVKHASTWFGSVIGAVDTYQDLDNNWPSCGRVVLQALYNFGAMGNAVGGTVPVTGAPGVTDYRQYFVNTCGKVESKLPSIRSDRYGLKALIEKGRALSALGKHEAAVEALNRVSTLATSSTADPSWARGVDQEAKRALNDVIAAIPSEANLRVPPDILFKAAEGSLRDGSYGRAIRVYHRVLLAVDNEPDPARRKALAAEFSSQCWMQINECYGRMDRWLEAFHAANFPVQQYLASGRTDEDQEIDDLAHYRMLALQYYAQKVPADQKAAALAAVEEARKFFTEKFPWSDKGKSTVYTVALGRLVQAQSMKGSADPERAAAAYREAIDGFRKLDAKDPLYRMAQARIGEALVSWGKSDEGLKHLQDFLRTNAEYWKDPNTAPAEKQSWGWAVFWIASAHSNQKQFPKVVETLEGFEAAYAGAKLEVFFPRIRYLRATALKESGKGDEAEKVARLMIKENADSGYTPQATLVSANDLQARAANEAQAGNRKAAADLRKRALELYDFWIARSSGITADNYKFVGQLHDWAGDGDKAAELWGKALTMYEAAGNEEDSELIKVYLSGLLVGQGKYAEALPKFEDLFVKTPDTVEPIREVFQAMVRVPSRVDVGVHREKVKKQLGRIAEMLAKDPDVAALAPEAKRAAAGAGTEAETEMMIRIFADKPEQRRALARAMAFTILGESAELVIEVKVATFGLVKRQPDLMSNIARCYEELWLTEGEYGLRALNIYGTLIEAAKSAEPGVDDPGARYSERWFDWKYRWTRLFLNLGVKYQLEAALRTVCAIHKSMATVDELKRADVARENFSKEFQSLKDQADAALRKMNREGCK